MAGAGGRPATVARVGLGLAVLAAQRLAAGSLRAPARGVVALTGFGIRTLAASAPVRRVADGVRARTDALVQERFVPYLVASVVPKVIDGIVPYLEARVVPELVDSTLPLLRSRVLPVVIEDLTHDPMLRTLLLEQSRSLVGQTTERLRDATSRADDRVEHLYRHFVHRFRG